MPETNLGDFARTLAAKVELIRAGRCDATGGLPRAAVREITEVLHEAKRDPVGWHAKNRWRPPAERRGEPRGGADDNPADALAGLAARTYNKRRPAA